jgi:hypothetical protein
MNVWTTAAGMAAGAAIAAIVIVSSPDAERRTPSTAASATRIAAAARSPADTSARALAELETLREELRTLRNRHEALTLQYAGLERDFARRVDDAAFGGFASAAPEPAAGAAVIPDSDPLPYDDNALDGPVAQANRLAAMDNAMSARSADPAWDDGAAATVTSTFNAVATSQSRLLSAGCHGGLCRVEVHHADEEAAAALLEGDEPLVPWNHKGRVETIRHPSGESTTILYVTRDGAAFPAGF